jgi:hypothetical protein
MQSFRKAAMADALDVLKVPAEKQWLAAAVEH